MFVATQPPNTAANGTMQAVLGALVVALAVARGSTGTTAAHFAAWPSYARPTPATLIGPSARPWTN